MMVDCLVGESLFIKTDTTKLEHTLCGEEVEESMAACLFFFFFVIFGPFG